MTSDPAHKSTDLNEIEASPQICGQPRGSVGRIPFAFLEDIHQRFVRTYGRSIHSAAAYAMNDEFSRILSKQMDHYSNDPNADRLNRLKGEMSHVRSVMIDNIEKIVERGDRLNLLVDKTATLHRNTVRFKRQARRYKSSVCWGNCKLASGLVCLILIIIYVTLAFYCRDPLWRYCF
ncbi:Vesicle-associated membrane protein 711 [Citrus sinensis]|nr:Vesicle-associated membrane protein 711 [Citrus sinensis]